MTMCQEWSKWAKISQLKQNNTLPSLHIILCVVNFANNISDCDDTNQWQCVESDQKESTDHRQDIINVLPINARSYSWTVVISKGCTYVVK